MEANSGIQGISDEQDDVEVYGNIIQDVVGNGINFCGAYDQNNFKIYNNTIEGCTGNYGICVTQYDGDIKNNIIWDSGPQSQYAYYVTVLGGGALDSDNNLIGPESANYIYYGGDTYSTLAAYVAAKTQDVNSTKEDPLFMDAGNSDFTLQYSSPAHNAGANLGATYKRGLRAGYAVTEGKLKNQGGLWDLGAYPFDWRGQGVIQPGR